MVVILRDPQMVILELFTITFKYVWSNPYSLCSFEGQVPSQTLYNIHKHSEVGRRIMQEAPQQSNYLSIIYASCQARNIINSNSNTLNKLSQVKLSQHAKQFNPRTKLTDQENQSKAKGNLQINYSLPSKFSNPHAKPITTCQEESLTQFTCAKRIIICQESNPSNQDYSNRPKP